MRNLTPKVVGTVAQVLYHIGDHKKYSELATSIRVLHIVYLYGVCVCVGQLASLRSSLSSLIG